MWLCLSQLIWPLQLRKTFLKGLLRSDEGRYVEWSSLGPNELFQFQTSLLENMYEGTSKISHHGYASAHLIQWLIKLSNKARTMWRWWCECLTDQMLFNPKLMMLRYSTSNIIFVLGLSGKVDYIPDAILCYMLQVTKLFIVTMGKWINIHLYHICTTHWELHIDVHLLYIDLHVLHIDLHVLHIDVHVLISIP